MSMSKQNNLSRQFSDFMGKANLKNPGNPSNVEVFYIQQSLVEAHSAYEAKQGQQPGWEAEGIRKKRMVQGLTQTMSPGTPTEGFLWNVNTNSPPKTYVQRYQELYTCDVHTAVSKLSSFYGLDCSDLFGDAQRSSQNVQRAKHYKEQYSDVIIPSFQPPDTINIDDLTYNYRLAQLDFIAAPKGLVLRVLGYFDADGAELQIPLHIEVSRGLENPGHPQYKLRCGLGKGSLPLYNLNYIDSLALGAGTVFLCEDLRVAVALSAIIMDSKRLGDGKYPAIELYAATGWYGGARLAAQVDFKPLWNKRIVFIPAINRSSYTDTIQIVKDYCIQAEVKDFRINRPPLLKASPNYDAYSLVNEISDPWERYLAKSAVVLRDCESLRVWQIAEEAISWDDYQYWGESVGLFPRGDKAEALSSRGSFSKTNTLPQLREHFPLGQDAGVRLDLLGAYNNMTVIYGPKNSSKSMLALAVAVGRAGGQGFLGLEAMPEPTRVLYVDGETHGPIFLERLERTMSAFRCNQKLVEDNLNFALLRADRLNENIDFEDEHQKNELEKLIRRYGSELIIFDNLQSLVAGFRSNNATKAWESFRAWLLELENKFKAGALVMHHDNADGGTAGSTKVEWQAVTLFHLMGRDSLQQSLAKKDHDADLDMYREYLTRPGAIFRAKGTTRYRSCEPAPFGGFLLNTTSASNRGVSGPPWQPIGHILPARHRGSVAENEDAVMAEARTKYPGRTEDEYKILGLLYAHDYAAIHEVRKVLAPDKKDGCSPSTARARIRPLIDGGIVDMIGQARDTRYKLRDDIGGWEGEGLPAPCDYVE